MNTSYRIHTTSCTYCLWKEKADPVADFVFHSVGKWSISCCLIGPIKICRFHSFQEFSIISLCSYCCVCSDSPDVNIRWFFCCCASLIRFYVLIRIDFGFSCFCCAQHLPQFDYLLYLEEQFSVIFIGSLILPVTFCFLGRKSNRLL